MAIASASPLLAPEAKVRAGSTCTTRGTMSRASPTVFLNLTQIILWWFFPTSVAGCKRNSYKEQWAMKALITGILAMFAVMALGTGLYAAPVVECGAAVGTK